MSTQGSVSIRYQRRWRLADADGKSVAEGFTSPEKAAQWAREQGLAVQGAKAGKKRP